MIIEIWKHVVGYKGLYEVSNMGRVRRCYDSWRCPSRIAGKVNSHGYTRVNLFKNKIRRVPEVAHLVLRAFIGPRSKGKQSSHLNDIKTDNRLENLRWMTPGENMHLAFVNGRQNNKGKHHPFFGKHHSLKTRRKISHALKQVI